jgi:hypothetical protein
LQQNI